MNARSLFGTSFLAAMTGLVMLATSASAFPTTIPGSICHARSDSKTQNFDFSPQGIEAQISQAGEILCPLVVQQDVSDGLMVDVSVARTDANAGSTSCSLASYDWTGKFLGVAVGTITPPSQYTRLTLDGTKTATYAYYTVKCQLPFFQALTTLTVLDEGDASLIALLAVQGVGCCEP